MSLDGPQRKRLKVALEEGFKRSELTQLVSFTLNKKIDSIAGNGDLSEVTFKLIEWCEENTKLTTLIKGAYEERPDNAEIEHFFLQFCKPVEPPAPSRSSLSRLFPEACEFDMDALMNECLSEIYPKRGLVGLVMPYAEEAFRIRFCERLKKELGRKNISIRDAVQIDPYVSIDLVVARLARYKKELLRNRDVICPVPFAIFDPTSSVPDTFWQAILEKFEDKPFEGRLIIFMYGREKAIFPQGPVKLCPPSFEFVHSFRWTTKIAELANWPESTKAIWHQKIVTTCKADNHENLLDIWQVYEHLKWSLDLFQKNISEADFLQELETWS